MISINGPGPFLGDVRFSPNRYYFYVPSVNNQDLKLGMRPIPPTKIHSLLSFEHQRSDSPYRSFQFHQITPISIQLDTCHPTNMSMCQLQVN